MQRSSTENEVECQESMNGGCDTIDDETLSEKYHDFSNKLVCIRYPGIVNDVGKMIETLGGMENIETVVANLNRRLDLRFRPDDKYCKPCYAGRDLRPGILLKIKVRQPKWDPFKARCSKDLEPDIKSNTTYNYEVLGTSAMVFSFNRLCDFQYLPLVSKGKLERRNTKLTYIYNKIIPKSLPDYSQLLSEEARNMTLFFPPASFARVDSSQSQLFFECAAFCEDSLPPETADKPKTQAVVKKKKQAPKVLARRRRTFQKGNTICVDYTNRTVPTEAVPNALMLVEARLLHNGPLQVIKEIFDKRPIWSKNAILYLSKLKQDQVKILLPVVAYHFNKGPWRIMWIKFGYDPRKEPNSRLYQTLDFRVRSSAGIKLKIQPKRSYSKHGPYTSGNITRFSLKEDFTVKKPKKPIDECHYVLRPGMIPPARQMFYQFCDVFLPEIQEMIARLPKVSPGIQYDMKNGWLPSGFSDQCRQIASDYIVRVVKKQIIEDKEKQSQTIISKQIQDSMHKDAYPTVDLVDIEDSEVDTDSSDEGSIDINRIYSEIVNTDRTEEKTNGNSSYEEYNFDLDAAEDVNRILDNVSQPSKPVPGGVLKDNSEIFCIREEYKSFINKQSDSDTD